MKKKILIKLLQLCLSLALSFYLSFNESKASENSDIDSVSQLLNQIKENALQLGLINSQQMASNIEIEKNLLKFKTNGFFEGNYFKEKLPQTSPFSKSDNSLFEYAIGAEKLWSQGILSKLQLSFDDSTSEFYNGSSNNFLKPTIEFSLKSNIFQDIFQKRYRYNLLNQNINKKALNLSSKIEIKSFLARSLLDYSRLLEFKEEHELQKKLCQKIRVQANKLYKKRQRQSVSQREYLLGLRESNNCKIATSQMDQNFSNQILEFNTNYNLTLDRSLLNINSKKLFTELENKYDQSITKNINIEIKNLDQIKSLELEMKSLENQQKEIEALSKSDLSIELKAGTTGLSSSFSKASESIAQFDYSFIFLGFKMGLPWHNREAKLNQAINSYNMESLKVKMNITNQQIANKLVVLNNQLKADFKTYKNYLKSISYSRQINQEARNDFNKGKIDFFKLADFNRILIQDQKSLSTHRGKLLVNLIEFLDFYNFFEPYID